MPLSLRDPRDNIPKSFVVLLLSAFVLICAIALLTEDWGAVRAYKNCLRSGKTDAACIPLLHHTR